jgi:hypothetical protein
MTKQEFVDWFYDQIPYFPTPDQCYDKIVSSLTENEALQKQLEYYKELAEAAEKVYVWQLRSPDSDEFHKAFDHWQQLKSKNK